MEGVLAMGFGQCLVEVRNTAELIGSVSGHVIGQSVGSELFEMEGFTVWNVLPEDKQFALRLEFECHGVRTLVKDEGGGDVDVTGFGGYDQVIREGGLVGQCHRFGSLCGERRAKRQEQYEDVFSHFLIFTFLHLFFSSLLSTKKGRLNIKS